MNPLLARFRDALERDWTPLNRGRLIAEADYERAWQEVEFDIARRVREEAAEKASLLSALARDQATKANEEVKRLRTSLGIL